jgi:hypothetical protein
VLNVQEKNEAVMWSYTTKRVLFHIVLSGLLIVVWSCRARQNVGQQAIPEPALREGNIQDPNLVNLTRMYHAAQDQFARRAVCLRAIDEGAIRRGVHIRSVDQIFGTNLESEWGARKLNGMRVGVVHFVPDLGAPLPASSDQKTEGRGFFGWFLGVDYDDKGVVQSYDLSNIHKGDSRGEPGRNPSPVAELKALYAAAKSESDRREICFRAIDEGIIKTNEGVATIDEIFGTHLASQFATKKEDKGSGIVDLASSTTADSGTHKDGANGWFMAVEYYSSGKIANYYLTNVSK